MKNVQTQMETAALTTKMISRGIKRRMSKLVFVAAAISAFSTAALAAPPVIPFLPSPQDVSTVPPNGDVNPYGVAFVPHDFTSSTGPLQAGDILVSNFNNSSNQQGTGTTIVRIATDGLFSYFFNTPIATLGGPCNGLSTAQ